MEIYQAAFENAPDPILFVDGEGRIVRINPEGERVFGYAPGELTGTSVDLLLPARLGGIHHKHREAYMEAPRKRVMGSGLNLLARRKDGSEFPVDIMLSPAHTSEGTRVIAIVRDITERKNAEKSFRELAQRQTLSAEAAGMGYWTFDKERNSLTLDPIAAALIGGSPEDFPDAESVRKRVVPEDLERRQTAVWESLDRKGRYVNEFRIIMQDGSIRWLADMGQELEKGESSGRRFAGVIFDVTDRKIHELEAEAARRREKELMESAPEGIFLADIEGRYTDVNISGCRMLGLSREEIVGKAIVDFIPPEEVLRLGESKDAMLAGEFQVGEWSLRRKDGSYLPVEVNAKILPDGRWLGFVRDITQRKELERKQQELVANLQTSLREIRVLRGLLPICSHCKKIRDDSGFWQQLEVYIRDHSDADFSHSICPACLDENFPEYAGKLGEAGGRDVQPGNREDTKE